MKVKVPSRIQVGGHFYRVIYGTSDNFKDDGRRGRVNYRTLLIEIDPERPASQQTEALLHEVLHCINSIYATNRLDDEGLDHFSEGLIQLFVNLGIELDWGDIQMEG